MHHFRYFALLVVAATITFGCGGGETKAPEKAAAPEAPAKAAAGKMVDPSTAGNVSGQVNYSGEAGKKARIRMNADPTCAASHSSPVYAQDMEINENGTLEWAFVWVKQGLEDYQFSPPGEPVELDQEGCVYHPHVLGVEAGQNLKIVNSDNTTHNINPSPANNRDWNVSQSPGQDPILRSFARQEVMIPVKCNVHPWMRSYIGVVGHPYFSVTGTDGHYELKGLPPGEYTIEVWHERLGTQDQKVTVETGKDTSIDFNYGG